jgi:hypothetical protein
MNQPNVLLTRFEIGKELTHHELQQAFKNIHGHPIPRGANPAEVARGLAARSPLRFEFEVNRLRGFAWDADELA